MLSRRGVKAECYSVIGMTRKVAKVVKKSLAIR